MTLFLWLGAFGQAAALAYLGIFRTGAERRALYRASALLLFVLGGACLVTWALWARHLLLLTVEALLIFLPCHVSFRRKGKSEQADREEGRNRNYMSGE